MGLERAVGGYALCMLWARASILAMFCLLCMGCRTVRIADWHHTVVLVDDSPAPNPDSTTSHNFTAVRTGDRTWLFVAPAVEALDARGFAEALVSWNIDLTPGSCAAVDIRVRRGVHWSPWLRVGVAGDESLCGPAVRDFEDVDAGRGRIDIDFFVGDGEFDAAQVAVTATAPSSHLGDNPATVRRLGVCLSSATHSWGRISQIVATDPRSSILHPVPFRSQRTPDPDLSGRLCSPTSVSMVLAHYGHDHSVSEVASRAYDRTFDLYGNWPRNLQAAWELGLPGHLTRFNDWATVSRQLEVGPIIASIRAPRGVLHDAPYQSLDEGHLIVLTGLDGKGGIFVNDPAAGTAEQGQRVYSMRDLTTAWMSLGNGTAYVLGPGSPKPRRVQTADDASVRSSSP